MKGAVLLALIGVLLAAVLGYTAHVVAQDTIALPAVSLESERPLAPEQARPPSEPRIETVPTRTETETETETEDETREDDSGRGSSNSGSGSSNSGSGSDNSGRGSDDD